MTSTQETMPKIGTTKKQREAAAKAIRDLPEEVREAAAKALEAVWAQVDKEIERHKDDLKARKLVGARVPRQMADRIQAAAEAQGLTVYAWTMAAFTAQLLRDERPPWA